MHYIKPFLVLIQVLPDQIYNVGDESVIYTDTIGMDNEIVNRLRKV